MNTSWKRIQHSYKCMLAQIDNPPIQLLRPSEFKHETGYGLNAYVGRSDWLNNVVTVRRNMPLNEIKEILWHEVGHILFRSKPHWWIECYGFKMSRHSGYGHYSRKYGHNKDELPSRKRLIDLSKKATKRMKAKVN